MKVKDKRKKSFRCRAVLLAGALAVWLTACANPFQRGGEYGTEEPSSGERADTGFIVTGPDSYDSADTAIFVDRDGEKGTATFLNLDTGKRYTLSIDGTTCFYDKYGGSISFEQVDIGDIVDVTFLKSKKHLTSLQLSPGAWSYEDVEKYEINTVRGEVSIGSGVYKLTSNTQYLSEGRSMDSMDLNAWDVLSFQGIDSQILTVRVERGHGYLRLVNDENFVGGWIEIGQKEIRRITEDMLLVVPEGNYQVSISNRGGGGVKSVTISRNEETTLDIGDLEIPEPQYGMVLFSLDPSSAELYIDGEKTDPSGPVDLMYGIHQLIARAEGYQSVTQYIRVAQESVGINVVLDPNASEEDEKESSESSADTVTDYYKVYVDAPEGVEVYLDGNYVGISPCSFRKSAGVHVVTLRKSYYETRSYTIQVDDEEKDISFSFAGLIYSGTSTVSGNTASGNTSSR
ncbi:MAG: PEGA domain-containing protein [Butyrivibrio sp.]|nr:PEGA domain-containing protein [Acetatifactor muris]MCM1561130.1 PEGA domain-containing protein [Butyrivibrio sp.]